ncbi:MAG: hypothetical protein [Malazfec virus 3]
MCRKGRKKNGKLLRVRVGKNKRKSVFRNVLI